MSSVRASRENLVSPSQQAPRATTPYASVEFPQYPFSRNSSNSSLASSCCSTQTHASDTAPVYSTPRRVARGREAFASGKSLSTPAVASSPSQHHHHHHPSHQHQHQHQHQHPSHHHHHHHHTFSSLPFSSSPLPSGRVLKGLPGYDALQRLHSLLAGHTNSELAYHLTKADATCFLLSPRPGEDYDFWNERTKKMTSSSGVFVGLQVLSEQEGEKLWKKLYFRHLSISQLVSLSILSGGDATDRTKMLRRFIELACMLLAKGFGNLFGFVAVMQGIATSQVLEMTEIWDLLHKLYPEVEVVYEGELKKTADAIQDGTFFLNPARVTVPPIQYLRPLYRCDELVLAPVPSSAAAATASASSSRGASPAHHHHDDLLLGSYSSVVQAAETTRFIVSGCWQFCHNSFKKLEGYDYNAVLFDFLMQDYSRTYLQHMGLCSDEPMERKRRFALVLDALVERVKSCETV